MKKVIYVEGLRPTIGKEVNAFIENCGLGTNGAFIPTANKITLTLKPEVTQEKFETEIIPVIKRFYEKEGWVEVKISAI